MNILEVGIENGRKEGRLEGHKEGRIEGQAEGEMLKLLSLIRRKLQKGQDNRAIAEALEEPEGYIAEIVALLRANPERTDQELLEKMKKLRQPEGQM